MPLPNISQYLGFHCWFVGATMCMLLSLGTSSLLFAADEKTTGRLIVEDRLNAEVRKMLKQYDAEFDSGRADYQKMFVMVKSKLVKERSIVL